MVDSLDLGSGMAVIGLDGSLTVLAATTTILRWHRHQDLCLRRVCVTLPGRKLGRERTGVAMRCKVDGDLATDAARGTYHESDGLT